MESKLLIRPVADVVLPGAQSKCGSIPVMRGQTMVIPLEGVRSQQHFLKGSEHSYMSGKGQATITLLEAIRLQLHFQK